MRGRALLLVVCVLALAVVGAAGATRVTVSGAGGAFTCPSRALPTALSELPEGMAGVDALCVQDSQQRMYAVTAAVMGLVLISGLLTRDRP